MDELVRGDWLELDILERQGCYDVRSAGECLAASEPGYKITLFRLVLSHWCVWRKNFALSIVSYDDFFQSAARVYP